MIVDVPNYGEVQFPDDMSMDDVSSAIQKLTAQKGGEKANEDEIKNQPQADKESYAGRETDQQIRTLKAQADLQTGMQLPPEDQGERQRDDQASRQVVAQKPEEVQPPSATKEFVPPPLPDDESDKGIKLQDVPEDFLVNTISKMEEASNKGMAGIARTLEAIGIPHGLTEYFEKASEDAPVDWKILTGVDRPEEGGAMDVATSVASMGAKLPAYALAGPVGLTAGLLEGYGANKEEYRKKLLAKGDTEQDANNKSTINAAISTAAAIPLYMVAGSAASKLASAIPLKKEIAKKAIQGGINFALNSVASMGNRAVSAALMGEDPVKAAKDLSLEGAFQDAFFAIHSTVNEFKNKANAGQVRNAVEGLPDATLAIIANKSSKYRGIARAEIVRRKRINANQALYTGAKDSNLPETAEVIKEVGAVEIPPMAAEEPKTITLEAITPPEAPAPAKAEAPARVYAATFTAPNGIVFEGTSHIDAMESAERSGAITKKDIELKKDAPSRNTDEFGFKVSLPDGRKIVVSREVAGRIARESGQAQEGEFSFGEKMHSNEVDLDILKETPLQRELNRFRNIGDGAPPEGSKDSPKFWHDLVDSVGVSLQEMQALGVKGAAERFKNATKGLYDKTKQSAIYFADMIHGRNTLRSLREIDAFYEAVDHAYSKSTSKAHIEYLISGVFPNAYSEKYHEKEIKRLERKLSIERRRLAAKEKMNASELDLGVIKDQIASIEQELSLERRAADETSKTMDILVKDNILGGLDEINSKIDELSTIAKDLENEYASGKDNSVKKQIDSIKNDINDLVKSRDEILKSHDVKKYESDVNAVKGTEIEQNINRWKEFVNPVMDELYMMANNAPTAPPTNRGRVFGARINLLDKNYESMFKGNWEDENGEPPTTIVAEYVNPNVKKDMLANAATFTGDYSTDVRSILTNSLAKRYSEGTKLKLYKKLLDTGNAVDDQSKVTWKETSKAMPVMWPEFDKETKTIKRTQKTLYVPESIYNDLDQVLNASLRPDDRSGLLNTFTAIQLASPTDAIIHTKNLTAIATSALGRESAIADIISKIPFVGTAMASREIRSIFKELEQGGSEIKKEVYEISRLAGLRPHYKDNTIMGKLQGPTHDFLKNADLAVRIILNRRFDNLVKRGLVDDTKVAKADFINQVGEYNSRVMNRWERGLRNSGVAPFVVAGRAMNRFSRNQLVSIISGDFGFKPKNLKASMEVRAIQASALAMAALVPSMINLLTTGSMWGRPGTPIGAIDFGPRFDTSDGKHRVLDFLQLLNIRRGLRQLGIQAAVEGIREGQTMENIFVNAFEDAKVVTLHPFVGPGVGMAISTATGERFDLRSGFLGSQITRDIGGSMKYVERARAALKEQNHFVYNLGMGYVIEKAMEQAGIPRPAHLNEGELLKDLGMPEGVPIVQQLYDVGVVMAGAAGGKTVVTPALKYATQKSKNIQYTPEEDVRQALRTQINRARMAGREREAEDAIDKAYESGQLTKADIKNLKFKEKHPDILVQRVTRNIQSPKEAVELWGLCSPEEQDLVENIVRKKITGSSVITPKQKNYFLKNMNRLAKPGTNLYIDPNIVD